MTKVKQENSGHIGGDMVGRDKIQHIKKVNTVNLDGNNNVVIQGVDKSNITVNITVPFEDFVEKYTREKDREIDNLYQSITELRQLNNYKQTDLRNLQYQIQELSEQRTNLEQQVKENIKNAEQTDFSKMDDLYQAAYVEFLKGDIDRLLDILNKNKLEKYEAELSKKRQKENYQVAQNRILRAKGLAMNFEFEEAEGNYKIALQFDRSPRNLFEYAYFIQEFNQLDKAENLYEEALRLYKKASSVYLPDLADVLSNLSVLQQTKKKISTALKFCKEALWIRRKLVQTMSKNYLPDVAVSLNTLGVLQSEKQNFPAALKSYKEALEIRRVLAQTMPSTYLSSVAATLNNLGLLQSKRGKFLIAMKLYKEALWIYRELEIIMPSLYLPDIAITLHNLGVLQNSKQEFSTAFKSYNKALQIRRKLAQIMPSTYLPDVAMSVLNLSIFYLYSQPAKEKSITLAKEVLEIAEKFPQIPNVQDCSGKARQVLQAWKD
jgi:Tfp pilus assembly protein PilF